MYGAVEKSKGSFVVIGGEEVSTRDRAILIGALMVKGGLLGAYVPFFTLWLHAHGYPVFQVGVLSAVDTVFSIILMPILGIILDKWRCHNRGLVGILLLVAVLKTCYLPVAQYFWPILVLTALTAPLLKAANSVLDAQCLFAFPAKGDFPKIRMWGSLGFGLIAFMTGHIVNANKSSSNGVATTENINAVFYTFAALTLFGAFYWEVAHHFVRCIRPDMTPYCWETYRERLRELYALVDFEIALLFVNLFLCGMALGIVGSYEFIMLSQLNMPVHLMGMCRLTGVILEMPFWFFCGTLMDTFGIRTVQTVAVLGNSIRLVWYGFMSHPWHALAAEVLHGCTFALPYASISVMAGRLAPESTKGLVQSVVLTIFGISA
eukprot:GEMP01042093.1.p1 GENE.GEMP01042093.1~~GEMP01042093.1.p1  ORF type:complete len:377 (+),score=67.70 GEMP01042093.1:279-1409(+)